ncbi:MAG: CHC2 zinc finger domain-containing protein [Parabacteroides sp.]|nr:CHC2 zinc finger domain-containing protein [Parabacteroides sp.]
MKKSSPQSQYIEDHVKIETVMGWYAPLTVNHNGKALIHCPFHADKHPSMHVNTNKGKWACYVCNKGGDAISFVMEKENCTFPEALNLICSRHGGPAAGYDKTVANHNKPVANSKSQINSSPAIASNGKPIANSNQENHEKSDLSNGFPEGAVPFRENNSPDSAASTQHNQSGSSQENQGGCTAKGITGCSEDVSASSSKEEKAGFCQEDEGFFAPLSSSTQPGQSSETKQPKAPEATPAQLQAMTDENVSFTKTWYGYEPDCPELCQAYVDFGVGLVPLYPSRGFAQFRGRIAFPIHNEKGTLVGFTCRSALKDESSASGKVAKYINSANSDLYNKSKVIYGLYQAIESIRREGYVDIVEGPKDCIAMHAAGNTNTVALCGSALSEAQIELLKQYTRRVSLVLDNDAAGQKAASRIASQLLKAGISVMNCQLPDGEDPDSLFRKLGKEAFRTIYRECTCNNYRVKYADNQPEATLAVRSAANNATDPLNGDCIGNEQSSNEGQGVATTEANGNGRLVKVTLSPGFEKVAHLFTDEELDILQYTKQNQHERPRLESMEQQLRREVESIMRVLFYTSDGEPRTEVLKQLANTNQRLRVIANELGHPNTMFGIKKE